MSRGGGLAAIALAATVGLVMLPLVATLVLAGFRYDALNSPVWIGFDHLRRLLADPYS